MPDNDKSWWNDPVKMVRWLREPVHEVGQWGRKWMDEFEWGSKNQPPEATPTPVAGTGDVEKAADLFTNPTWRALWMGKPPSTERQKRSGRGLPAATSKDILAAAGQFKPGGGLLPLAPESAKAAAKAIDPTQHLPGEMPPPAKPPAWTYDEPPIGGFTDYRVPGTSGRAAPPDKSARSAGWPFDADGGVQGGLSMREVDQIADRDRGKMSRSEYRDASVKAARSKAISDIKSPPTRTSESGREIEKLFSDPRWEAAGNNPGALMQEFRDKLGELEKWRWERKPFPWDLYREKKRAIILSYRQKYTDMLTDTFGVSVHGMPGRKHAARVVVPVRDAEGKIQKFPNTDVDEYRAATPSKFIPDELKLSTDVGPEIGAPLKVREWTAQTTFGPKVMTEEFTPAALTSEAQVHPDVKWVFDKDTGIRLSLPEQHKKEGRVQGLQAKLDELVAARAEYIKNPLSTEGRTIFTAHAVGDLAGVPPTEYAAPARPPELQTEELRDFPSDPYAMGRLREFDRQIEAAEMSILQEEEGPGDVLMNVRPGKELKYAKSVQVKGDTEYYLPILGITVTVPGNHEVWLAPHDADFYLSKRGGNLPPEEVILGLHPMNPFGRVTRGEMVEAQMEGGYRVAGALHPAESLYHDLMLTYNPGAAVLGAGTTVADYWRGVEGDEEGDLLRKRHGARHYDPREQSPHWMANFGRWAVQFLPSLMESEVIMRAGLGLSGSQVKYWRGGLPHDVQFGAAYDLYGFDPTMFELTGGSKSDLSLGDALLETTKNTPESGWHLISGLATMAWQGAYGTGKPEHAYEKSKVLGQTLGDMYGAIGHIGYGVLMDPRVAIPHDPVAAALIFGMTVKPVVKGLQARKGYKKATVDRAVIEEMKALSKMEEGAGAPPELLEVAEAYKQVEAAVKHRETRSILDQEFAELAKHKDWPALRDAIEAKRRVVANSQAKVMRSKGFARRERRILAKLQKGLRALETKAALLREKAIEKLVVRNERPVHDVGQAATAKDIRTGRKAEPKAERPIVEKDFEFRRLEKAKAEMVEAEAAMDALEAKATESGLWSPESRISLGRVQKDGSRAFPEYDALSDRWRKANDELFAAEEAGAAAEVKYGPKPAAKPVAEPAVQVEAAPKPVAQVEAPPTAPAPAVRSRLVGETLEPIRPKTSAQTVPEGAGVLSVADRGFVERVTESIGGARRAGQPVWGAEVRFAEPPARQPGWVKSTNEVGREYWVRETARYDIEHLRYGRNTLDVPRTMREGPYRFMAGNDPVKMVRWLREPVHEVGQWGRKWMVDRWKNLPKDFQVLVNKIHTDLPRAILSASKLMPIATPWSAFEMTGILYNRFIRDAPGLGYMRSVVRSPRKLLPATVQAIIEEGKQNKWAYEWEVDALMKDLPKTVEWGGKSYDVRPRLSQHFKTEYRNTSFTWDDLRLIHSLNATQIQQMKGGRALPPYGKPGGAMLGGDLGARVKGAPAISGMIGRLETRLANSRNGRIDVYRYNPDKLTKDGKRGAWEIDPELKEFLQVTDKKRFKDIQDQVKFANEYGRPLSRRMHEVIKEAHELGIVDNPNTAMQWYWPSIFEIKGNLETWFRKKHNKSKPETRKEAEAAADYVAKAFRELEGKRNATVRSLTNKLRQENVPIEKRIEYYGQVADLSKEVYGGFTSIKNSVEAMKTYNKISKLTDQSFLPQGAPPWMKPRVIVRSTPAPGYKKMPNKALFEYLGKRRVHKEPANLAKWKREVDASGKAYWETRDFVKIESKQRRFADLANKYVLEDVYWDIQWTEAIQAASKDWLAGYVRLMKGNFTIRHPGVTARNWLYNVLVFAPYGDINPMNPARWKLYEMMLRDTAVAKKSPLYEAAYKTGIFKSNFANVEGLVEAQGMAMRGIFQNGEGLLHALLEASIGNKFIKERAGRAGAFKQLFQDYPGMLYGWMDSSFKYVRFLRYLEQEGWLKKNPATKQLDLYNKETRKFGDLTGTTTIFQEFTNKAIDQFGNYETPRFTDMFSTPMHVPGLTAGVSKALGLISPNQFMKFMAWSIPQTVEMTWRNPILSSLATQGMDALTEAFSEGVGLDMDRFGSILDVNTKYNRLVRAFPRDLSVDKELLLGGRDPVRIGRKTYRPPTEVAGRKVRLNSAGEAEFHVQTAPGFDPEGLTGERPAYGGERKVRQTGVWLTFKQIGNKDAFEALTGLRGDKAERIRKRILDTVPLKGTFPNIRWMTPGSEFVSPTKPGERETAADWAQFFMAPQGWPIKYLYMALGGQDPTTGKLALDPTSTVDDSSWSQIKRFGWTFVRDHLGIVGNIIEDYARVDSGEADWLGRPYKDRYLQRYTGQRTDTHTTEDKFRIRTRQLLLIVADDVKGMTQYWRKKTKEAGLRTMGFDEVADMLEATNEGSGKKLREVVEQIEHDRMRKLLAQYQADIMGLGSSSEKHLIIRRMLEDLLTSSMGAKPFKARAVRLLSMMREDADEWNKYIRAKTTDPEKLRRLEEEAAADLKKAAEKFSPGPESGKTEWPPPPERKPARTDFIPPRR